MLHRCYCVSPEAILVQVCSNANFGNFGVFKSCQIWQPIMFANFGNFGVLKICQFWLPTTFANFDNWWYLPILATFLFSKFANFGYLQYLPILATITCEFWQPMTFANFGNQWHLPILETDNICQFWQLTTFANFGNRWHLPILETDNICQLWQPITFANFWQLWCGVLQFNIHALAIYSYWQVEKTLCNKMHTETIMNKCIIFYIVLECYNLIAETSSFLWISMFLTEINKEIVNIKFWGVM